MKPSILRKGLILSFLMSLSIFAWSNDVTITTNGGNDVNGSFVAGVWTPANAGPSTIDYGNLLAELINGDVDITTVGNISFTASASNPTGLFYDLDMDRILSLSSGGDVTIERWGINPVSPPNTGKLTVNISATSPDGQLFIEGTGLKTNGGNLSILDFDEVYFNGDAVKLDGAMSTGNLNVNANVFKFGVDETDNINGSSIIAGNVQLTIMDRVEMKSYSFLLSGALTINTEDLIFEGGNFIYTPAAADPAHSLNLSAQNIDAKFFQMNWKADMNIDADNICFENFIIQDATFDNETDILVEADQAHFQFGEIRIINGKDTRSIKLDIAEVLRHTGVSVSVDRGDGAIEVTAQDSMFLYAFRKGGSNSGTGGRMSIREGNGSIKVESNYIHEQFYEKGILSGSGRVDIKADKYITSFSIPAHIAGPEAGGQTKGDTIIIDTRIYSQGFAEVSISNNEQPSFINIIATDSLNVGKIGRSIVPNFSDSRGGFIGFGADSKSVNINYNDFDPDLDYRIDETNAQANGDLKIEAGYFFSQWLYMGQKYGEGDIHLNATGDCILLNSSFEHYGARGDVSVDVGGKLKISQAEIAQKSGTGNTSVSVADSLLIHTASILQSADGDINVEAGSDLYMTFAKISHQGNDRYDDRGNPVDQYTGNLSVSAQNLVLPTTYDYSEEGAENRRIINGVSNSSIHADVIEGDVKVVVEDSVFLRNGAITNTVQNGTGNLTLQANILDMDQSCIVLDGSNDLLKVQVERVEYEFAGIEAKNGDASIIVAGETMTTENACVGTDGGDIFLTFKEDIDLSHTYLGSKGGNIDVASLEGGVSVTNGDDPSNQPDGTDGIFTGDTGVNGGDLMISACTSIDIVADINTGMGSGGSYSEMGTPIATSVTRRLIGQGNAEMIIDDNCTMLEVSITDPCDCENPNNQYDGLDIILFHETVIVTGAPGDTWKLAELIEGAIFDQNGNEITDLSSISARAETNGAAVDYIFEFWHQPSIGYNAIFEATSGPSIGLRQGISNSCNAEPCIRIAENLPSIPKWSLFLLSIMLLSLSIFLIIRTKG